MSGAPTSSGVPMSLLIANQRLPWKRYWVPSDGNVHSGWDGTGFITEPEGLFGRSFNPDLRTIEKVIDRSFVVLSGVPGMGKTQVVRQLKERWNVTNPDEELIYVEGRTLDDKTWRMRNVSYRQFLKR